MILTDFDKEALRIAETISGILMSHPISTLRYAHAIRDLLQGSAEPVAWMDANGDVVTALLDSIPRKLLYTRPNLPPVEQTTIADMVQRFLCWKLPEDFAPDGGVLFNKTHMGLGMVHIPREYGDSWWPVGTNLLNAEQATVMVKHMLSGMLQPAEKEELERLRKKNKQLQIALLIKTEEHNCCAEDLRAVLDLYHNKRITLSGG